MYYPTIKSPEKDTRQLDLGNAQDGSDTRQLEILKRDTRHAEVKIHPARCFQQAPDTHWTRPKTLVHLARLISILKSI